MPPRWWSLPTTRPRSARSKVVARCRQPLAGDRRAGRAGESVIAEGPPGRSKRATASETRDRRHHRNGGQRGKRRHHAAEEATHMARFFIDRPIFAWVIAIVIMLAGGLSIATLSLEQYPNIAPTRRLHQRDLPRRLGQDHRGPGHAGDRAEDEGPRPACFDVVEYYLARAPRLSSLTSRPAPTPTWRRCRCRTSRNRPSRSRMFLLFGLAGICSDEPRRQRKPS